MTRSKGCLSKIQCGASGNVKMTSGNHGIPPDTRFGEADIKYTRASDIDTHASEVLQHWREQGVQTEKMVILA